MLSKYTLSNKITVMAERMDFLRSASIGVWTKVGSVDEDAITNGYSHFIEHLLFKGTSSRNSLQIAEQMDLLGGNVNAFTSKECTCYHAKVMDEHLERAAELLADLNINPLFDPAEMDKERGVILEEIAMVEDSPEDIVHDLLSKAHFGSRPLSRTILGDENNIRSASQKEIVDYKRRFYRPDNMVISVAGNFDEGALVPMLERYFTGIDGTTGGAQATGDMPAQRRHLYREKDTEQTHICIGFKGAKSGTDETYTMAILSSILGGGMSSRLFQRLREKEGLVYSVYSYPSSYTGDGIFTLYAGTNPSSAQKAVSAMGDEIRKLLKDGIKQDEFDSAKTQLKVSFVLGQESSSSRMMAIGRGHLLNGRVRSQEEVLSAIDAVTIDGCMDMARNVLCGDFSSASVGREGALDFSGLV